MEYKLDDLLNTLRHNEVNINGKWFPCRPSRPSGILGLKNRILSAYRVLVGKSDAFTWPGGQ